MSNKDFRELGVFYMFGFLVSAFATLAVCAAIPVKDLTLQPYVAPLVKPPDMQIVDLC